MYTNSHVCSYIHTPVRTLVTTPFYYNHGPLYIYMLSFIHKIIIITKTHTLADIINDFKHPPLTYVYTV